MKNMESLNRFFVFMICGERLSKNDKCFVKKVYYEVGRDEIYNKVIDKKITPFAAKTLSSLGYDRSFWNKVYQKYFERNCRILTFLNEAYIAMEANGVKKMFVSENFGALLSSNSDLGLFSSSDIDNYADYSEKDKINTAMKSIGCEIKERHAVKNHIASEFFPNVSRGLPNDFYLSVDFFPLARLKLPCFVNADDFVDWNSIKNFGNTKIKLPPPEALMYICLLHISLHSYCRAPDIRLYIDIMNMTKLKIDYAIIARWCIDDKTKVRVAVSASISNILIKANIPSVVSDAGKRSHRLGNFVFDGKEKVLRAKLSKFDIMRIDMMCDDNSNLRGLVSMLFPNKFWMKKTYGNVGFTAFIKHLKRMI